MDLTTVDIGVTVEDGVFDSSLSGEGLVGKDPVIGEFFHQECSRAIHDARKGNKRPNTIREFFRDKHQRHGKPTLLHIEVLRVVSEWLGRYQVS